MYEKLLKTVTNLGSPKVLIVGDFMVDVYIYGDATRISPEAPVPVLKIRETKYNCGGAGSVAIDVAVLGAKPICLGIVGNDDMSGRLREMLVEYGADVSGLVTVSNRPTISKQRLIGLAQHRHQQQLFRMDSESSEPLTDEQYRELFDTYNAKLSEVDIVCLQDYNKGLLNDEICRKMVTSARTAGKTVLVDPAYISDYSKYSGATLIAPNRQEASAASGIDITDVELVSTAAKNLKGHCDLDAVVITLDKQGAYLESEEKTGLIPTRPRNVYDVTGAGDIVLSMLAVTLAAKCDYETAVTLANLAGGIEVEKFGVASVSIDEIINEIVGQNRGKSGKIKSSEDAAREVEWHRVQKDKVVFTNGCFDVVHRGHIEYLKFCRDQGDVVVVGLNSDQSVRTIKGPERPVNNQKDRAAVLSGLESVDIVVIFDEPDPLELIRVIKPDILVKGQDWQDKGVVGREFIESRGGQVILAPLVEGKSSTKIIDKLKTITSKIKHIKVNKDNSPEENSGKQHTTTDKNNNN